MSTQETRALVDDEIREEVNRARAQIAKRRRFSLFSVDRAKLEPQRLMDFFAPSKRSEMKVAEEVAGVLGEPRFSLASVKRTNLSQADMEKSLRHAPWVGRAFTPEREEGATPAPPRGISPLDADRSIRREQDAAYAMALQADRAKQRLVEQQEAARRALEELATAARVELEERPEPDASSEPPTEGDTVCRVQVRASSGRVQRRFWSSEPLRSLISLVLVEIAPETPTWRLVDAVSREDVVAFEGPDWFYGAAELDASLGDSGLTPSATLFLVCDGDGNA
mmetsp:Transcript_4629/g.18447  ORF Transcript_4629/g.18447 Transcript_4629/m.18447 type:complete len:281 (-) Transcript_4629:1936-2778(-)